MSNLKSSKRGLGLALSLIYFLSNVVLLHAYETHVWKERRSAKQMAWLPSIERNALPTASFKSASTASFPKRFNKSQLKGKLSIPLNIATIKEIHLSENKHTPVIHVIQDVHMNYEAQRNIVGIIEALKVPLVGVEGTNGRFDFRRFRAFPDAALTKSIADHFLKDNRISAPSYVGLTTQKPMTFYGVDDESHYHANVKAYRDAVKQQKQLKGELAKLDEQLEQEKGRLFNPRLKEFDELKRRHEVGALSLGAYAKYLSKTNSEPTHLANFLRAFELEQSLDFNRVEAERKYILGKLTPLLKPSELSDLIEQSLAYRAGHVSYADYYNHLQELMSHQGLNISHTPAFESYLRYVLLAESIDAEKMLGEIKQLEEKVLVSIVEKEEEKALLKQSREQHLLGKLLDFALTPGEWNEYKKMHGACRTKHERASHAACFMHHAGNFSAFEKFYELADLRSQKMVENLLKLPSAQKVLIAGGFHAELITEELKRRGVSYTILQPKLTTIGTSKGTEYLSVFTQEKTPLERLLQGEKLYLANDGWLLGRLRPPMAPVELEFQITQAVKQKAVLPESDVVVRERKPNGEIDMTVNPWRRDVTATDRLAPKARVLQEIDAPKSPVKVLKPELPALYQRIFSQLQDFFVTPLRDLQKQEFTKATTALFTALGYAVLLNIYLTRYYNGNLFIFWVSTLIAALLALKHLQSADFHSKRIAFLFLMALAFAFGLAWEPPGHGTYAVAMITGAALGGGTPGQPGAVLLEDGARVENIEIDDDTRVRIGAAGHGYAIELRRENGRLIAFNLAEGGRPVGSRDGLIAFFEGSDPDAGKKFIDTDGDRNFRRGELGHYDAEPRRYYLGQPKSWLTDLNVNSLEEPAHLPALQGAIDVGYEKDTGLHRVSIFDLGSSAGIRVQVLERLKQEDVALPLTAGPWAAPQTAAEARQRIAQLYANRDPIRRPPFYWTKAQRYPPSWRFEEIRDYLGTQVVAEENQEFLVQDTMVRRLLLFAEVFATEARSSKPGHAPPRNIPRPIPDFRVGGEWGHHVLNQQTMAFGPLADPNPAVVLHAGPLSALGEPGPGLAFGFFRPDIGQYASMIPSPGMAIKEGQFLLVPGDIAAFYVARADPEPPHLPFIRIRWLLVDGTIKEQKLVPPPSEGGPATALSATSTTRPNFRWKIPKGTPAPIPIHFSFLGRPGTALTINIEDEAGKPVLDVHARIIHERRTYRLEFQVTGAGPVKPIVQDAYGTDEGQTVGREFSLGRGEKDNNVAFPAIPAMPLHVLNLKTYPQGDFVGLVVQILAPHGQVAITSPANPDDLLFTGYPATGVPSLSTVEGPKRFLAMLLMSDPNAFPDIPERIFGYDLNNLAAPPEQDNLNELGDKIINQPDEVPPAAEAALQEILAGRSTAQLDQHGVLHRVAATHELIQRLGSLRGTDLFLACHAVHEALEIIEDNLPSPPSGGPVFPALPAAPQQPTPPASVPPQAQGPADWVLVERTQRFPLDNDSVIEVGLGDRTAAFDIGLVDDIVVIFEHGTSNKLHEFTMFGTVSVMRGKADEFLLTTDAVTPAHCLLRQEGLGVGILGLSGDGTYVRRRRVADNEIIPLTARSSYVWGSVIYLAFFVALALFAAYIGYLAQTSVDEYFLLRILRDASAGISLIGFLFYKYLAPRFSERIVSPLIEARWIQRIIEAKGTAEYEALLQEFLEAHRRPEDEGPAWEERKEALKKGLENIVPWVEWGKKNGFSERVGVFSGNILGHADFNRKNPHNPLTSVRSPLNQRQNEAFPEIDFRFSADHNISRLRGLKAFCVHELRMEFREIFRPAKEGALSLRDLRARLEQRKGRIASLIGKVRDLQTSLYLLDKDEKGYSSHHVCAAPDCGMCGLMTQIIEEALREEGLIEKLGFAIDHVIDAFARRRYHRWPTIKIFDESKNDHVRVALDFSAGQIFLKDRSLILIEPAFKYQRRAEDIIYAEVKNGTHEIRWANAREKFQIDVLKLASLPHSFSIKPLPPLPSNPSYPLRLLHEVHNDLSRDKVIHREMLSKLIDKIRNLVSEPVNQDVLDQLKFLLFAQNFTLYHGEERMLRAALDECLRQIISRLTSKRKEHLAPVSPLTTRSAYHLGKIILSFLSLLIIGATVALGILIEQGVLNWHWSIPSILFLISIVCSWIVVEFLAQRFSERVVAPFVEARTIQRINRLKSDPARNQEYEEELRVFMEQHTRPTNPSQLVIWEKIFKEGMDYVDEWAKWGKTSWMAFLGEAAGELLGNVLGHRSFNIYEVPLNLEKHGVRLSLTTAHAPTIDPRSMQENKGSSSLSVWNGVRIEFRALTNGRRPEVWKIRNGGNKIVEFLVIHPETRRELRISKNRVHQEIASKGKKISKRSYRTLRIGSYAYVYKTGSVIDLSSGWIGNEELLFWAGKTPNEVAKASEKPSLEQDSRYLYNQIKDPPSRFNSSSVDPLAPSPREVKQARAYFSPYLVLRRRYDPKTMSREERLQFLHWLSLLMRNRTQKMEGQFDKSLIDDRLLATEMLMQAAEARDPEFGPLIERIMWSAGILMVKADSKAPKRRIKAKIPFSIEAPADVERLGRVAEEMFREGTITPYFIINIKIFSPESYLAYLHALKDVSAKYNGNVTFIVSVEEPETLEGDLPGASTALRRTAEVLGQEFLKNNHIGLIQDGGTKSRAGPLANAYMGYSTLAPLVRVIKGTKYDRLAVSTFLDNNIITSGISWLQMRNYGKDILLWLPSDVITQFGAHPRFGRRSLRFLPFRFMGAGGERVQLFDQGMARRIQAFAWHNGISIQTVMDPKSRWLKTAKDQIEGFGAAFNRARSLFYDPRLDIGGKGTFIAIESEPPTRDGSMTTYLEKPSFSEAAEQAIRFGRGAITVNVFFITIDKWTAWELLIRELTHQRDPNTGQRLGQVAASVFHTVFQGRFNLSPNPIGQAVRRFFQEHRGRRKIQIIGINDGDGAITADRGTLVSNRKMYEEAVNARLRFKDRFHTGTRHIPPNVIVYYEGKPVEHLTAAERENALFLLRNVHVEGPADLSCRIDLKKGSGLLFSVIRFREGFTELTLAPGSFIVDSEIAAPVNMGENALLQGVRHTPDDNESGPTHDFPVFRPRIARLAKVPQRRLTAVGGQTTVTMLVNREGSVRNEVFRASHRRRLSKSQVQQFLADKTNLSPVETQAWRSRLRRTTGFSKEPVTAPNGKESQVPIYASLTTPSSHWWGRWFVFYPSLALATYWLLGLDPSQRQEWFALVVFAAVAIFLLWDIYNGFPSYWVASLTTGPLFEVFELESAFAHGEESEEWRKFVNKHRHADESEETWQIRKAYVERGMKFVQKWSQLVNNPFRFIATIVGHVLFDLLFVPGLFIKSGLWPALTIPSNALIRGEIPPPLYGRYINADYLYSLLDDREARALMAQMSHAIWALYNEQKNERLLKLKSILKESPHGRTIRDLLIKEAVGKPVTHAVGGIMREFFSLVPAELPSHPPEDGWVAVKRITDSLGTNTRAINWVGLMQDAVRSRKHIVRFKNSRQVRRLFHLDKDKDLIYEEIRRCAWTFLREGREKSLNLLYMSMNFPEIDPRFYDMSEEASELSLFLNPAYRYKWVGLVESGLIKSLVYGVPLAFIFWALGMFEPGFEVWAALNSPLFLLAGGYLSLVYAVWLRLFANFFVWLHEKTHGRTIGENEWRLKEKAVGELMKVYFTVFFLSGMMFVGEAFELSMWARFWVSHIMAVTALVGSHYANDWKWQWENKQGPSDRLLGKRLYRSALVIENIANFLTFHGLFHLLGFPGGLNLGRAELALVKSPSIAETLITPQVRPHNTILQLGDGLGDAAAESIKGPFPEMFMYIEPVQVGKASSLLVDRWGDKHVKRVAFSPVEKPLPFDDQSMGAVIAFNFFSSHSQNKWPVVLEEVKRVLQAGRRLVIFDQMPPSLQILSGEHVIALPVLVRDAMSGNWFFREVVFVKKDRMAELAARARQHPIGPAFADFANGSPDSAFARILNDPALAEFYGNQFLPVLIDQDRIRPLDWRYLYVQKLQKAVQSLGFTDVKIKTARVPRIETTVPYITAHKADTPAVISLKTRVLMELQEAFLRFYNLDWRYGRQEQQHLLAQVGVVRRGFSNLDYYGEDIIWIAGLLEFNNPPPRELSRLRRLAWFREVEASIRAKFLDKYIQTRRTRRARGVAQRPSSPQSPVAIAPAEPKRVGFRELQERLDTAYGDALGTFAVILKGWIQHKGEPTFLNSLDQTLNKLSPIFDQLDDVVYELTEGGRRPVSRVLAAAMVLCLGYRLADLTVVDEAGRPVRIPEPGKSKRRQKQETHLRHVMRHIEDEAARTLLERLHAAVQISATGNRPEIARMNQEILELKEAESTLKQIAEGFRAAQQGRPNLVLDNVLQAVEREFFLVTADTVRRAIALRFSEEEALFRDWFDRMAACFDRRLKPIEDKIQRVLKDMSENKEARRIVLGLRQLLHGDQNIRFGRQLNQRMKMVDRYFLQPQIGSGGETSLFLNPTYRYKWVGIVEAGLIKNLVYGAPLFLIFWLLGVFDTEFNFQLALNSHLFYKRVTYLILFYVVWLWTFSNLFVWLHQKTQDREIGDQEWKLKERAVMELMKIYFTVFLLWGMLFVGETFELTIWARFWVSHIMAVTALVASHYANDWKWQWENRHGLSDRLLRKRLYRSARFIEKIAHVLTFHGFFRLSGLPGGLQLGRAELSLAAALEQARTRSSYDYYDELHLSLAPALKHLLNQLLGKFIRSSSRTKVLELGAGGGPLAGYLIEGPFSKGLMYVELDQDQADLSRPHPRRMLGQFQRVAFAIPPAANALAIIADDSLDAVVGFNFFNTVSQKMLFHLLLEVRRVLKEGGQLIVVDDLPPQLKNLAQDGEIAIPVWGWNEALSKQTFNRVIFVPRELVETWTSENSDLSPAVREFFRSILRSGPEMALKIIQEDDDFGLYFGATVAERLMKKNSLMPHYRSAVYMDRLRDAVKRAGLAIREAGTKQVKQRDPRADVPVLSEEHNTIDYSEYARKRSFNPDIEPNYVQVNARLPYLVAEKSEEELSLSTDPAYRRKKAGFESFVFGMLPLGAPLLLVIDPFTYFYPTLDPLFFLFLIPVLLLSFKIEAAPARVRLSLWLIQPAILLIAYLFSMIELRQFLVAAFFYLFLAFGLWMNKTFFVSLHDEKSNSSSFFAVTIQALKKLPEALGASIQDFLFELKKGREKRRALPFELEQETRAVEQLRKVFAMGFVYSLLAVRFLIGFDYLSSWWMVVVAVLIAGAILVWAHFVNDWVYQHNYDDDPLPVPALVQLSRRLFNSFFFLYADLGKAELSLERNTRELSRLGPAAVPLGLRDYNVHRSEGNGENQHPSSRDEAPQADMDQEALLERRRIKHFLEIQRRLRTRV